MVKNLPLTLTVQGYNHAWAGRKKTQKQVHVSPPPPPSHLSRVGCYKAQSMVHAVIMFTVHCASGDDWGSR